jgi:hypothetical protein
MALTVGDLFTRESAVIKEDIGNVAMELMPEIGGSFFADMMLNDMDVSSDGIGRDYLIKKRFYGGLAGKIRGGNVSQHWGWKGDSGKVFGDSTKSAAARDIQLLWRGLNTAGSVTGPQVGANPLEGPNPRGYGLTSKMYSSDVALAMSLSLLRANANKNVIKDQVSPLLKGFAKNIALHYINSFFVDPANSGRLCSLPTSGWTWDDTNRTLTFSPTEQVTHRLMKGVSVDIFKTSGGTVRYNQADGSSAYHLPTKRVRCFVLNVDHWSNEITLIFDPEEVAVDGSAGTYATYKAAAVAAIASGLFLIPADTYGDPAGGSSYSFSTWYGWRHWLVNTGNVLGSDATTTTEDDFIPVDSAQQFKSGSFTSVGALNETKMIGHLMNAERALDPWGYFIDTIISSEGVLLNVFDQTLSRERVNYGRNGAIASFGNLGLKNGLVFTTPSGRSYRIYESRFVEDGNMIGLRRSGNWEIKVPPAGQGITRGGTIPDLPRQIPIDFYIGALSGGAMQRLPLTAASGGVNLPTEFSAIFGTITSQLMPKEQIPGCVWSGVSTTRYYST